jgi:hypothetical protein
LHSSVLPTPVGPRKRKEPYGRLGSAQTGARAADGVGHQAHGLVLPDHALVHALFHVQQLFAFALHHLADRNAGRAADHFGDFLGADLGAQQPVFGLFFRVDRIRRLQLGFELRQLAVLQFGELVVLTLALQFGHLRLDPVDFFLDLGGTEDGRFFGLPDFLEVGILLGQLGDFLLDQRQALLRGLVLFLLDRLALDLELDHPAVELSIDSGLESISILIRAAASSIRSIALSGRKRSVM